MHLPTKDELAEAHRQRIDQLERLLALKQDELEEVTKDRDEYARVLGGLNAGEAINGLMIERADLQGKLESVTAGFAIEHEKFLKANERATAAENRLEVVSKEVEAVEALLEKATNDVSAWNSRASGAESRLHSLVSQAFESVTLGELRDWIINNVEPDRRPVAVERQKHE